MTRTIDLGAVARVSGPTEAAWRLVCLPHAGGSAGTYARLGHGLADPPHIVALQYPGHETRVAEEPLTSYTAFVAAFAGVLGQLAADETPTVLLGHSFGASLAAALSALIPVDLLVLSGRPAPGRRRSGRLPADDDRDAWRAWLRRLGGTPEVLLGDEPFLDLAIRALRGDLTAAAEFDRPGPAAEAERGPLRAGGLLTVAGRDDPVAGPSAVAEWMPLLAPGGIDHGTLVLEGGHFALFDQSTLLLSRIRTAVGA
ncbi:MAG: alpha/beta fold hydrolase [Microbacterium enclense]